MALVLVMGAVGCGGSGGKKTEMIAATSGTPQSATVGTAFGAPLVATVMEGTKAVSGVMVTFAAPATGASGTFAGGTNTAMTNASGVATSAVFSANSSAGVYMVTATAVGVTGSATYSLTNNAGAAASIAATSGTPQSAAVGAVFGAPLVATVEDSGKNPVSGVVVTFTPPAAGASGAFAGGANTAMTNMSGVAMSAAFTANATVGGPYIVTAKVPGVATAANFSLTNTVPPPEIITATSGTPQSAMVGTAFAAPLVATVTKGGAGVSGVVVTFTPPATGASGTFAGGANTATTNASGVAMSAVFSANATVGGPYTVAATATGIAAPANFILTNAASAPETIAATSGTPQSATISTAFAVPLVATVTKGGAGVSGVVVTFTPPATGASGTFAGGANTATTNASGVATSAVFSANGTVGGPYTVTATATGIATPANFSLTNTAATTSTSFSFFLTGQEVINGGPNFYALAGAVQISPTGTVLGGEQDYNDAFGVTSPEPAGDKITGGMLSVSGTTGQGTLTLITNNTALGKSGTETLAVQFVNANHAMVAQYDGSATSSGSLDLQTLSSPLADNFAFSFSGVDTSYNPVGVAGVFTTSGGLSGKFDANDDGTATTGTKLSGTISAIDMYGRGTITGAQFAITLKYYMVGPEVLRIIDMDTTDAGVGSAFGQGTGTFSNTSLGKSVLSLAGNSFSNNYATLGIITPTNPSFSGIGDDNELSNSVTAYAAAISGTYAVAPNGYGTLTVKSGTLGDVSALGLYLTDPKLNLLDPNNTASGTGGGLLLDLDDSLAGGTGLVTPQTDPTSASFTGSYAFGAQVYNTFNSNCPLCEFDFVAQGKIPAGTLTGSALISDPFNTLTSAITDTGTFTGTPLVDTNGAGRYTLSQGNAPANPLTLAIGTVSGPFDVVIHQANGGQLFWLEADDNGVWLGTLQHQSLTGVPAAAAVAANPK